MVEHNYECNEGFEHDLVDELFLEIPSFTLSQNKHIYKHSHKQTHTKHIQKYTSARDFPFNFSLKTKILIIWLGQKAL